MLYALFFVFKDKVPNVLPKKKVGSKLTQIGKNSGERPGSGLPWSMFI